MYSREQIVEMVEKINWTDDGRAKGIKHISDMLEEIQDYLLHDKYPCKFARLCGDGDWRWAIGIADSQNKEILEKTTLFQDFVRVVGRESKINKLIK